MCGSLLHAPYWGPGPQPKPASDWEIEPEPFGSQASTQAVHWATTARAKAIIFGHGFLFNFTAQETESGHGIMEEPELTLVSTSDISIAEMDFANLTLEEKNEAESLQVNIIPQYKYTSFIQ